LFLCDKNTYLLTYLIARGKLTPVACKAESLPSPERLSVITVTETRPEGRAIERSLNIRKKPGAKHSNMPHMPCCLKPKSVRWRRHARLK